MPTKSKASSPSRSRRNGRIKSEHADRSQHPFEAFSNRIKREFKSCVAQEIGTTDGLDTVKITVYDFVTANKGAKVELKDSTNTVLYTWKKNTKGNTYQAQITRGSVKLHYHGDGSDRSDVEWSWG